VRKCTSAATPRTPPPAAAFHAAERLRRRACPPAAPPSYRLPAAAPPPFLIDTGLRARHYLFTLSSSVRRDISFSFDTYSRHYHASRVY